MQISSPRLRRLDSALAYLAEERDVMTLSRLDGFLAGLIITPMQIPSTEWMPLVWNLNGGNEPFASVEEAEWYASLVLDHHAAILRSLNKGRGHYKPFLEIDRQHNEIEWELWIDGFRMVLNLQPDAWAEILDGEDAEIAKVLSALVRLVEVAHDMSDLDRAVIDKLTESAPELIPAAIDDLYAWRTTTYPDETVTIDDIPPPAKIGRNDPCPCGSGKKYKKCCGMN